MINNSAVFYIASFLIISFALCSMFLRNIIYSLLCAIMVFFTVSVFFYMLGSEYNAIIQAAIYGIAVPVIIGLSIMFTIEKNKSEKGTILQFFTVVAGILFAMAFVYVIMISLAKLPDTFHFMGVQQFNSYDVISTFANGIFVRYVWAFELFSLLLIIIIAGFTVLDRKNKGKQ